MENKSGDGEKERERKTLDRISLTERKSLVVIHLRDTHRYRRNRLCSERKPAWKLDERSFQVVPKFDSRGIGRLSHGPGILRVQKRFTGHRQPVAHFSPPPPHTQLDSTTHETSSIDRSIDRVHPNSKYISDFQFIEFDSIHAKKSCRQSFRNQLAVCLLANMNIRYFWRREFYRKLSITFFIVFPL